MPHHRLVLNTQEHPQPDISVWTSREHPLTQPLPLLDTLSAFLGTDLLCLRGHAAASGRCSGLPVCSARPRAQVVLVPCNHSAGRLPSLLFLPSPPPPRPLLQRLHWIHVPLLTLTPLLALYGLWTSPFVLKTWAFAVLYYFITGLGITAG